MANIKEIRIPDIGDFKDVTVVEILVTQGKSVKAQDSLITIESEKASVEIPTPYSGTIKDILVKIGDKVSEGTLILTLDALDQEKGEVPTQASMKPASPETQATPISQPATTGMQPLTISTAPASSSTVPHASPSVRRFARELGVDLLRVSGSGPKGRITKEDVQAFVKAALSQTVSGTSGVGLPSMPRVDFSKFGPTEIRPLSRIKKLAGTNLHRNWMGIPHVTHHENADITELEALRKTMQVEAEKQGTKLTLLAFIVKAVASTLKQFPDFNSSLAPSNDALIIKKYFNIGIAVDAPDGLVVPVLRDVDKKSVLQIAQELSSLAMKAREGKLSPLEIRGGNFSISSLGGIGGSGFTPIINAPDVAVLGVSKATLKPEYVGNQLMPRLILPLSLSYDHRVIDGAAGARFCNHLASLLSNILQIVL